jgi:hypothetical protein
MAIDLTPLVWDWSPVIAGDTYPAANIVETAGDESVTRVRLKLRLSGTTSTALLLDSSTSGITINNAATRDITIGAISTTNLAAGYYSYQMEWTYTSGTVRTEFTGTWQIREDTTP